MLLMEVLGSALLGLGLAAAAVRLLARRLPSPRTVLVSGVLGALFGAYLMHFALGPGHNTLAATFLGAALVSAVVLSLLLRPGAGARRSSHRTPFSVPSRG
jgi:phage tail tape-measure protein